MTVRPGLPSKLSLISLVALAAVLAAPVAAQAPAAPPAPAVASAIPVALRDSQVALIVKVLAEAESHGFRTGEFAPADLDKLLASSDPAEHARGVAFLGLGSVRYAEAQHGGRLTGRQFLKEWSIRPEPYEAGNAFAQAAASDQLEAWFASLPPPYQGYQSLKDALVRYRQIAAAGGWKPLIAGAKSLKPGMDDPRVPALRERLLVEDAEVPAADPATPTLFDPALSAALARFQVRHGLASDGAVGKDTVAELNLPVERRIAAIRANMERWRWLPRAAPANRIEVNIASQTLERYEGGKLTAFMKTAAGRKSDPSPMLRSDIHSLVLNPPWNVPTSIATKEVWPKARRVPGYFQSEGFVVKAGGQLQQLPGPKSALGQVKFDFINSFGVYLHDTPAKSAFDRDARDVSHGCVRLEKAVDLAKAILSDDPDWSSDKIDEQLQEGDTVRVKLSRSIPVYLLYWTTFLDANGQINFRRDIYDWDGQLMGLLDAGEKHA